jgi:hypothetical protein
MNNISTTLFNNPPKFSVTSPLLQACMGHTSDWLYQYDGKTKSFYGFRKSKKTEGYIILCTLLQEAIGIYRYSFIPDRMFCYIDYDIKEKLYLLSKYIPENIWENAISELQAIYSHIQNYLLEQTNDHQSLILKRTVGYEYAHHICKLISASKVLGKNHITFEMDLLNSYLNPYDIGYRNHITIEHPINIKNVLYANEFLNYSNTEPGEWVVINPNKSGLMNIPLSCIKIHDDNLQHMYQPIFDSISSAKQYLDNHPEPYIRTIDHIWSEDHIISYHSLPTKKPRKNILNFFKEKFNLKL